MSQLAVYRVNAEDMLDFFNVKGEKNPDILFEEDEKTLFGGDTVFAEVDQVGMPGLSHRLIVLSKDNNHKTYPIISPRMTIGRSENSDIRINDKSVSLCHAQICVIKNECYLKDLNSKNGTAVNGRDVNDSQKLRDGDKVQIGATMLIFAHKDASRSFSSQKQNPSLKNAVTKRVSTLTSIILSRIQKLSWRSPLAKGALAIVGIIAIFVCFNRVKASNFQSASSINKNANSNNGSEEQKNATSLVRESTTQSLPANNEQALSPDNMAERLAEKARQHYVDGELLLSIKELDEALRLNLSDDSPLKAKVLSIREKIVKIDDFYKEGLLQYKDSNSGRAMEIWSRALKADREITNRANSYIATQIAGYIGDIFYKKASRAYKKGDLEQAREMCSQTLRAQPSNEGCHALLKTISKAG